MLSHESQTRDNNRLPPWSQMNSMEDWAKRGLGSAGLSLAGAPWQKKVMWYDLGPGASVVSGDSALFRKGDEDVWIFPQVSINAIDSIDSVQQSFKARYTLFLNVTMTEDEYRAYHADSLHWEPSWLPVFMPYNAVEVHTDEAILNPDRSKYFLNIQRGRWCYGFFKEQCVTYSCPFDMRNFPFDVQCLVMKWEIRDFQYSWTRPRARCRIFAEPYFQPYGSCASFQNVWVAPGGDWRIESSWLYGELYRDNKDSWGPAFQVKVMAQRRWRFFFFRIVVIMMMLSLAAVSVFALEDLGDSLGYVGGLLIAAVAFMFTVGSYMPAVGYLTVLDKYLFSQFAYIFLCGVAFLIIDVSKRFDVIAAPDYTRTLVSSVGIALGLWVAVHTSFAAMSASAYMKEVSKDVLKPSVGHEEDEPPFPLTV